MADDTSTKTEDTSVSEDTSTNEGTQSTEADSEFDDIVDNLDLEELETNSDETDESDSDEAKEDSATSEDDATEEESKEDDDESDSEEAEDTSTDEEQPPEEKVDPKEEARLRYEERQREKAEQERRDQAKREAQDKYLEGAQDDKDLALRQLQIDAYNNRVERNTSKLESSLERAVNNIDLFKDGTPAVKNRLIRAVEQFDALHVKKDRNGDPIEVTGDLVEYLQSEADSIRELLGDGARQQSSDKSKQKSRTVTPPVKAPKKPKSDPALEGFDDFVKRGY